MSDKDFNRLARQYGTSAATTYDWLIEQGQTHAFARQAMLDQVAHLGASYSGGLDCTPYRQRREATP